MRGKWAQGIEPRFFRWIITGRIAVCERPGGYGESHRRVRRNEEVLWILNHDFDRVISLIPSPYNLSSYREHGLAYRHMPFAGPEAGPDALASVLAAVRDHAAGERVLVHGSEVGDRIGGVVASYLLWTGLVDQDSHAVSVTERLLQRELGPVARELVSMVELIPASAEVPVQDPAAESGESAESAGSDESTESAESAGSDKSTESAESGPAR